MNSDRTVLVTGATGRQGGAAIRYMLPKGWRLRALVFRADDSTVQGLTDQGIEAVRGDLEDPASLERAVRGAYGVYSIQDFWSVGAKREVQQGKNMADAPRKAGVEHFVYSSVGGAERKSGIDHWESKWKSKTTFANSGLPATMIRPAAFMENYYIDQVEIGILRGKLLDPIRADKPYQTIASSDIGAFVALAFERPKEFIGGALEIAGSELTNPKRPKSSAVSWASRSNSKSFPWPWCDSFWAKSSTRCSGGSTKQGSTQTFPNYGGSIQKSIFRPWRNG